VRTGESALVESKVYVPKPWGREYIVYENEYCAIWLLELNPGAETSFHCHSKKSTGLICLEGSIELRLLNHTHYIGPLGKINIHPGRFHSSRNTSNVTSYMLEIESPVNKCDLIRWDDKNGRVNSMYESNNLPFQNDEPRLDLSSLVWGQLSKIRFNANTFSMIDNQLLASRSPLGSARVFPVLSGGFIDELSQQKFLGPGDVLSRNDLTSLVERFQPSKDFQCIGID